MVAVGDGNFLARIVLLLMRVLLMVSLIEGVRRTGTN